MSAQESPSLVGDEKHAKSDGINTASFGDGLPGHHLDGDDAVLIDPNQGKLHRNLKGRHMQMIAIGGAIGAGLFVSTASAFTTGGPGSVLIGFLIIGFMIYLMMQALAELAVLYPVNGAFTMYICRFIDPSWGFACGWQYGISWLTVLPFEISAACNIIHFWTDVENVNDAAWIIPLLVALTAIQFFGVRGYGEVEFVLSTLKVVACTGFILLGIIIDCGGVPTDNRGYIGAKYWHNPGAFLNGFHGFCTVFVTASFSFSGTELTGLAAAEAEDPVKEVPKATKQVVWRICIFYILTLFLIGLIVPADSPLYNTDGAESRHSPFVIAIELAGIKALPSIFNTVILISVMSVANSCTFGSTRTFQALAQHGMGPKIFAYVDKKGRPLVVTLLQLLFGCLAFINLDKNGGGNIFTWLLSLSGLASFFIFGSVAIAHIRFRSAWKLNGHSIDELPFRAAFGIWGSYVCAVLNFVCLAAQFYVALYPVGPPSAYLNPTTFFQDYLAGPFLLFLYLGWKGYSWFVVPEHRPLYVKIKDIDIYTGMREGQLLPHEHVEKPRRGPLDWAKAAVRNII
ncbi:putative amino-acid permease P7G5.06 [Lachnellula cervina]|uniref:Putative amino-acid permease P7G5.06 n=1 Tax=Lachnellula cervina TaxID=1316786 RepID=A0A7D8YSE5_9HELO|nr:putative amino-acid permease P7G5.06 [Lachnellula cervina]